MLYIIERYIFPFTVVYLLLVYALTVMAENIGVSYALLENLKVPIDTMLYLWDSFLSKIGMHSLNSGFPIPHLSFAAMTISYAIAAKIMIAVGKGVAWVLLAGDQRSTREDDWWD